MTAAPTLPQRVEHVRAALARLRAEKSLLGRAEQFQLRAQQFSEPAEKLAQLTVAVKTLRVNGIPIEGVEPHVLQYWRRTFEELQRDFRDTPESIVESNAKKRYELLEPLKRLPDVLRSALVASWTAWVAQQKPPLGEELLGVLEAVPALRSDVTALRTLRGQVEHLAASLPASEATVAAVRSACEEIARRWASLAGGGLPDEVIAFLRAAVGREGAAYTAVSPVVEAWLREHDLLHVLKVRLS